VGAVLFGIISDCFGRKWPLSADLWILAGLQVATAYVREFSSFIAIRAIFGVAMGGIWGLSAAMSMENMPVEARGLFSGLLQQGYALGYLIAAVVNITAVRYTSEGYKAIFHVGAGFTGLVALIVMFIPESPIFVNDDGENPGQMSFRHKVAGVWRDLKLASRLYWKIFLYCIALCMGFNWMSHGSQGKEIKSYFPRNVVSFYAQIFTHPI
jgi:SHS family lactate transporter-like MFS transporter